MFRRTEDRLENLGRQQWAYTLALLDYVAALHQEVARLRAQIDYFARQGRMVVPVNLAATVREEAMTSRHSLPPATVVPPTPRVAKIRDTGPRVTNRMQTQRTYQAHCPQCGDRHLRRSACKPERVARHQAWRQRGRDLRCRLQSRPC